MVRAHLFLIGFLMVLVVLKKRQSPFYSFLAVGAVSRIIFGIICSVFNMVLPPETFLLGVVSWLMLGFFSDVIFFSAAVGYRIRQVHEKRERSLQSLMLKEVELQQKELEKVKGIYQVRVQEPSRIAHDLHDPNRWYG